MNKKWDKRDELAKDLATSWLAYLLGNTHQSAKRGWSKGERPGLFWYQMADLIIFRASHSDMSESVAPKFSGTLIEFPKRPKK